MLRILVGLFLVSGIANYICSMLIIQELNRHGVTGGRWESRWHVHKHMKTYRRLTREATGKPGLPSLIYYLSLAAMIAFGGLLLKGVAG